MKRDRQIDWQDVRARLERNRAAIEAATRPGPERLRAVYRERAARLARREEQQFGGEAVLVFRLGSGRYGFELPEVAEILAHPHCAPIPGAPPEVAGVVQVRGEIRPVFHLWRLLQLPKPPDSGTRYVVLLGNGRSERGLMVTAVDGVALLRPGPPASARGVKWITPDLIAVLDAAELWKEDS